ncbi:LmeA family phospholipid-binding protein [Actinoplanes sp. URMC 104]|uniref:LmeA family phospholipid-binding protein n=1 Tax=Actinoplanes sp. URMC 104 TaxID=3423409 RepID=UPI003F1BEB69
MSGEVYGTQRPRKKRWGRRLLITLLVFLILLAAVLVALDRFAVGYAERMIGDRVSEQIADQRATSEKPDVTIEGIPFLTQVARGRYQDIRIQLTNLSGPAGNNRTVRVADLDVHALDVDAPIDTIRSGTGDIVAQTVTGTGTIDYPQLAELIGQPGLKLAEQNGKLIGSAPLQALGQTFNVSGAATVAVRGGVVQVRFSDVTAEGLPNVPLIRTLIDSYVQRLSVDLRVPELPLKLAVQKVEPTPQGLRFTAGADDVALNAGGL